MFTGRLKRIALAAVLGASLVFVPTAAQADAHGYQNYQAGAAGSSLWHTIKGSGRSASYQSSTTSFSKGCSARIDFIERNSAGGLLVTSTGTTIQGCVNTVSRERYNITFNSKTSKACAQLSARFLDKPATIATQCHGIS